MAMIWLKYFGYAYHLQKMYLVEQVAIDASPVVRHENFAFVGVELFEGGSESFGDDWKILAPLDLRLFCRSVGKVDEEQSMMGSKLIPPVDPVPHDVVVGPALEEHQKRLAVGFALSVVEKRLRLVSHQVKKDIINMRMNQTIIGRID
jgi:hypothetical protein